MDNSKNLYKQDVVRDVRKWWPLLTSEEQQTIKGIYPVGREFKDTGTLPVGLAEKIDRYRRSASFGTITMEEPGQTGPVEPSHPFMPDLFEVEVEELHKIWKEEENKTTPQKRG